MEEKFKGHRNVKYLALDEGVMDFTAFNSRVLTWPEAAGPAPVAGAVQPADDNASTEA
jgi:hypothetical protein